MRKSNQEEFSMLASSCHTQRPMKCLSVSTLCIIHFKNIIIMSVLFCIGFYICRDLIGTFLILSLSLSLSLPLYAYLCLKADIWVPC